MKMLVLAAFLMRMILIFYARIHDYFFEVNFTDIDYIVFTDAALLVRQGHSPYAQPTYRYTPLIAWLLDPNAYYADFGKVLFCAIDVLVGLLHLLILEAEVYQKRKFLSPNEFRAQQSTARRAALCWLFNPFSAIISARGSCDAIICALILGALLLLTTANTINSERHDTFWWRRRLALLAAAAVVHGAGAVHFRIFPLIYLPSIFLSIARRHSTNTRITTTNCNINSVKFKTFIWMCVTNARGYAFVVLSLASFAVSVGLCFALYGHPFLRAAFLYHLSRVDIQHNFSPYFLPLYLCKDSPRLIQLIGLCAFVPQICCTLAFAIRYSDDLPFCWFLTTFAFVSFNKVCTSQYFVWYLCFLPLLATRLQFRWQQCARLVALWLSGQALWLLPAYLLEFRGLPTFAWVWLASLTFLGINTFLIGKFVQNYSSSPIALGARRENIGDEKID